MRKTVMILGLVMVSCGHGGGERDTATDDGDETTDTAGDTAGDTAEDTATDTAGDTPEDTAEDTATDMPSEVECATDGDCDDLDPCSVDTCDLDYNECEHDPVDADDDGYFASSVGGTACTGGTDCMDDLATAHPGAPMVECSALDNDCNGNADEDQDGDGYVDHDCTGGDDCDDSDEEVFPGSLTIDCDPMTIHDHDCNGHPDTDNDADGFGAEACGGTDCDDLDAGYNPGVAVTCTSEDHNCNGHEDQDDDGDGHLFYLCATGDDCRDGDFTTILGECAGVNDCCDGCWKRNGCWIDPTTDLMWEDPPSGGSRNQGSAMSYCASLSLAGHGAGEWHLPTISESRTLIRGCPATEDGGACGVTDLCLGNACLGTECNGCSYMAGPGAAGCYRDPTVEGECLAYWSSSPHDVLPVFWFVDFQFARVNIDSGDMYFQTRCVRPGS